MGWNIEKTFRVDTPKGSYSCDLCGDNSQTKIRRNEDHLYLCSDCCHHKSIMAEGIIKESAVRFMIGNVI